PALGRGLAASARNLPNPAPQLLGPLRGARRSGSACGRSPRSPHAASSRGMVCVIVGGRDGRFVAVPARNDVLVNLVDLPRQCCLLFGVLAVQAFDQLVRRLLALEVGMVPVAEEELTAGRRMRADSPTSRLVAVVLLHELIHAGGDRAED